MYIYFLIYKYTLFWLAWFLFFLYFQSSINFMYVEYVMKKSSSSPGMYDVFELTMRSSSRVIFSINPNAFSSSGFIGTGPSRGYPHCFRKVIHKPSRSSCVGGAMFMAAEKARFIFMMHTRYSLGNWPCGQGIDCRLDDIYKSLIMH